MSGVGDLRARIEALPGMGRLLPALDHLPPAYLVGGAVRDLLRGAEGVDLDVAVEGDAAEAARALAEQVGGRALVHERFGTATVRAGDLTVDVAQTRRERYRHPGALPEVEAATLDADLARRDFTVNAMAVGLTGDDVGTLHDPHGGRADLDSGLLRVLHRHSFVDDPTRVLRGVRYEAGLGMRFEPDTDALARTAAGEGAMRTVSRARTRDAVLAILAIPEAPTALARLAELGVARALHPDLRPDPDLVASAQLAAAETGADPVLSGLAALMAPAPERLGEWVAGLDLPAPIRDRVVRAGREAAGLVEALSGDLQPSELRSRLDREPPEALALALALGAPGEPVLDYVSRLREVRLEIGGDDLIEAGVPESPLIGAVLDEVLRRKLDGQVGGREEELRMALEIAGEAG